MAEDDFDDIDISALLNSYSDKPKPSLRELFDFKLTELNISQTKALEIMGMESRALKGILNGTSARVDFSALLSLAEFLEIPKIELLGIFLDSLEQANTLKVQDVDKRKFILKNFDLTALKKEGIIDSTSDFERIEEVILKTFDYDSIFDYRKDVLTLAYSAGAMHKKNPMTDYWIEYSRQVFRKINNENTYNRKALIEYFPTIRWHTMNVEKGLWEVIRALYKLGITVVYLPKFSSMHIRGATFAVNKKPCIVLTDYRGFYPTLWFALIHELHHVLFDWEQILLNSFHLSGDTDLYTEEEVEKEANAFARNYLFSDEKMNEIRSNLKDTIFVERYSKLNHIHPSFPYVFFAYEHGADWAWRYANRYKDLIKDCLKDMSDISLSYSTKEVAKSMKKKVLN